MTVSEFENTVDNSLCGGNNTEENSNKLLTPCGKTVVTMETCADAEKPVALAYNALLAAKRHIEEHEERKASTTVLIIGANQLGRVSAEHAPNMLAYPMGQVNVFIADSSIKRLMAAEEVCSDVIFWSVDEHEQSLVEKTKSVCKGGVDLIMDFIGTPRTIQRAMKILNKGGALLIGSDALAKAQQQNIIGVPDNKKTNEVTTSDHFGGAFLIGPDALSKVSINLCSLIAQQQSIISVAETNEAVTLYDSRLHHLVTSSMQSLTLKDRTT